MDLKVIRLVPPPEPTASDIFDEVQDAISRNGTAYGRPGEQYAEHAFNECIRSPRDEEDFLLSIIAPGHQRAVQFRARVRASVEKLARGLR